MPETAHLLRRIANPRPFHTLRGTFPHTCTFSVGRLFNLAQFLSSLMDDLATLVRVTYVLKADTSSPTFQQVPQPSPLEAKAYQLLASYPVTGN
jgi:hypothetical protein